jgi:hypothetical protein
LPDVPTGSPPQPNGPRLPTDRRRPTEAETVGRLSRSDLLVRDDQVEFLGERAVSPLG